MATINRGEVPDFHPAYGYATAEEVAQLNSLKDGVEYRELLKKIAERSKSTTKRKKR